MTNLLTGSIVSVKQFIHTNKNDEQVGSSIAIVKLVDGSLTKVFAYANDISDHDVIFVAKIPLGTPLYEGGALATADNCHLFEGTSSSQKLARVNETLTICKQFSL